jgi:hypothetical protein
MPVASKNEQMPTVKLTRPRERRLDPFQGTDRLMTMAEAQTCSAYRYPRSMGGVTAEKGRPVTGSDGMSDIGGRRSRPGIETRADHRLIW